MAVCSAREKAESPAPRASHGPAPAPRLSHHLIRNPLPARSRPYARTHAHRTAHARTGTHPLDHCPRLPMPRCAINSTLHAAHLQPHLAPQHPTAYTHARGTPSSPSSPQAPRHTSAACRTRTPTRCTCRTCRFTSSHRPCGTPTATPPHTPARRERPRCEHCTRPAPPIAPPLTTLTTQRTTVSNRRLI
jgi:hypothetical protein